MNLYESDYWKLTVFVQRHIGLWLFEEKPWKTYAAWIYSYGLIISFMIPVGIRWYNELGVNVEVVVENAIAETYLMAVFFILTCHILCTKKLKNLYERVALDWKVMTDPEELTLMHKYAGAVNRIIYFYAGYMLINAILFASIPLFSPIFDMVLPLQNATRSKELPYYAEYGVDIETYFYALMCHAISGIGTVIIYVTYDLGFMLIVQHVVSIFELVNLRLSKVAEVAGTLTKDKKFTDVDDVACRHIVQAIKLHQKAINYVNIVESCYRFTWFTVLFANMVAMGCGIAVALMKLSRPEEVFRYGIGVVGGFVHFYYIFLPGQKIIDSSESVFHNCYGCHWYNLSKKSRSLIKIMMMRSLTRSELTGGNAFTLCMETFYKMTKFGFTIFTVVNSMNFMQHK